MISTGKKLQSVSKPQKAHLYCVFGTTTNLDGERERTYVVARDIMEALEVYQQAKPQGGIVGVMRKADGVLMADGVREADMADEMEGYDTPLDLLQ